MNHLDVCIHATFCLRIFEDPKLRKGQLQRYLRELKKKQQFLDDVTYELIYPSRSQPSRLYGTPKDHKIKSNSFIWANNFFNRQL